jgi:putative ABC transport system permease protein
MIKYFFKLEWRNLIRNKYISFLKIAGLVIGLWVFMVAGYYVLYELSFDRFQENADEKYCLEARDQFGDDYFAFSLPYPLTDSLQNRYPEVVKSVAFERRDNSIYIKQQQRFVKSDKTEIAFVEEGFFDFFSFKFIAGNAKNSFSYPNPIVISEEVANKHFGGVDAVGKPVKIMVNDALYDFVITGIVQNPPGNSNVGFHWVGSLSHFKRNAGETNYASDWNFKCKSYVRLTPETNSDKFLQKLTDDYLSLAKLEHNPTLVATPLTKVHVDNTVEKRLKIFSALGLLILIVSIVNYVLLSTVERTQQMRYLGIEKISGAKGYDVLRKNIISIAIYSTLAFGITYGLFALSKPYYSRIFDGSFTTSNLDLSIIVFSLLGAILSIVLLASFINQLIQKSQKPIDILKNKFARGKFGKVVFNSLLTFQLIAFIALISSSVFIQKQLIFMQNSKLGFNKESLITLKIAPKDVKSYQSFKTELLRHPSIVNVGATSAPPLSNRMSIYGSVFTDSLGNKQINVVEYVNVDRDFFKTLELKFKEGSGFPESFVGYCVVNQTFIDEKKIEHPMVEKIELGGKEYQICAIMDDFHQQSMRSKINPFVAYLNPNQIAYSVIRFSGNPHEIINLLKKTAEKYLPNSFFEYEFMDEKVKLAYRAEARFSYIIKVLTVLSVLIAVLGLLGLSYFSSLVKIKEIGIRKVNGAKVTEILTLLNKDFVKWVAIAFVVATPISWYAMSKWLESFAYKTSLSWWIFAMAGALALIIALLTVSWQSWKAATKNPVEALRYE